MQTWSLNPIDTLFFKEARPMEGPGTAELSSVFPPPPRTIMGALRAYIGDTLEVNWLKFNQPAEQSIEAKVRDIIGYGDDYADLAMQGLWIHLNGQRLYPAPLNLLRHQDKTTQKITLQYLTVGQPYHCDLGQNVCLPEFKGLAGSKPLQDCWLTSKGLKQVLDGKLPHIDDIISKSQLYVDESRLGIAINQQTCAVEDGMLYQTKHLRFKDNVSFSFDLKGDNESLKAGLFKLGGEGRIVSLEKNELSNPFPIAPKARKPKGLCLYLLTPLLLPDNSEFLPDFKKVEDQKQTYWQGDLHGIPLSLISSVIGKVYREGGWNAAKHQPRAVQSFIPAGSVFYCEIKSSLIKEKEALKTLNNCQIGNEQHLGRGHIAAGLWT